MTAGGLACSIPAQGLSRCSFVSPRGPHFLWSVDFDGSEWIYRVFPRTLRYGSGFTATVFMNSN